VSAEHIVFRSKELLVLRYSSWVVQVRASVSAEHLTPHTVPKLEREPLLGSWCKSEVYRTGTQVGFATEDGRVQGHVSAGCAASEYC